MRDALFGTRLMRLGFVGIGLMGAAMVRRLLDRGHRVTVWNLEPERLDAVVPFGARAAGSPAEVAAVCDIVLCCVLHAAAVERCVFAADGVTAATELPPLLIDLSTADPDATRRMAALARERGIGWVDAPVSGGPMAALEGTLTIMSGGSDEDFTAALPILRELGTTVTRMGPVGAGQTTKLVNQCIVGTGYVLMAEALVLAEAAGIDAARLPACLAGGAADGFLLQRLYPQMQARDFEPPRGYARQLMKDMLAVRTCAQALGLALPVVEAAVARYAAYVAEGNEMADSASVLRSYERNTSP
jgi:3-hydroxyisobutyrate dehydrogenase